MNKKFDKQVNFHCFYHVVWCVKYRRRVLTGEAAEQLEGLLREICQEKGVQVLQLDVQPDRVYLWMNVDPRIGLHQIVKCLKARSSHVLRERYPQLRSKLPTLWTNQYFVTTSDDELDANIQAFVQAQPRKQGGKDE